MSEWVSLAVEGSIHASALQQQQSGLVAGWLGRGLLGPGLGRPTDELDGAHGRTCPPLLPPPPSVQWRAETGPVRTVVQAQWILCTRGLGRQTRVPLFGSRRQSTTDLLSSELTVDVLHEGSWQRPTAGVSGRGGVSCLIFSSSHPSSGLPVAYILLPTELCPSTALVIRSHASPRG